MSENEVLRRMNEYNRQSQEAGEMCTVSELRNSYVGSILKHDKIKDGVGGLRSIRVAVEECIQTEYRLVSIDGAYRHGVKRYTVDSAVSG
jgi:hypothetical protein